MFIVFFFFKQKTAYEMRISDWSSDVCSSDLVVTAHWAFDPIDALQQAVLVLVVWSHGCIGLHLWLRLKPWYPTAAPAALAIAVQIGRASCRERVCQYV